MKKEGNNKADSNPGEGPGRVLPGQHDSGPDLDLVEQLYNKYARGGTRMAGFRTSAYLLFKRYSWVVVMRSIYLVKRILDIAVSSTLLAVLTPLFLVTALIIKLDSPGPVMYNQVRVGKWGRLFRMYKFRSMVVDADQQKEDLLNQDESGGVIFKIKRDPRITRAGGIIRRFSIDELPQLYNVLTGDMSLVGPRPPVPKEVDQYGHSDRRRLEVFPGITCIWQVSGRSEIGFKKQVELDVQYIESQSLWTDVKILLKTIPAVLLGRGAY